jgi:hypothetical protein
MANTLPPPPTSDAQGSYSWLEWFRQLRNYITVTGSVPWGIINFAGSNITDIISRSHQNLQALQGGTSGEYYHLTANQASKLTTFPTVGVYNGTATRTQSGIVTNATLVPSSGVGSVTLPANFFSQVGKQLHVRLCGDYTTDAAPGSATITLKFGSTTYATTGSFTLDGSATNKVWWWEGYITCRSTGATGTISGNFAWIHSENNATASLHSQDAVVTSPVTIDTTTSQVLDVQLTTTDAGTSFSCTCFTLWENF